MKRRIQRMAAAAVVMLAVVLIPECGVSVFAEETAENMKMLMDDDSLSNIE